MNTEPEPLPTTCALHTKVLEELTLDVKLIKAALLGDAFGNVGYKQRLERVEEEVLAMKRDMVKLDIRVSVIAVIVSGAAYVIKTLIFK